MGNVKRQTTDRALPLVFLDMRLQVMRILYMPRDVSRFSRPCIRACSTNLGVQHEFLSVAASWTWILFRSDRATALSSSFLPWILTWTLCFFLLLSDSGNDRTVQQGKLSIEVVWFELLCWRALESSVSRS